MIYNVYIIILSILCYFMVWRDGYVTYLSPHLHLYLPYLYPPFTSLIYTPPLSVPLPSPLLSVPPLSALVTCTIVCPYTDTYPVTRPRTRVAWLPAGRSTLLRYVICHMLYVIYVCHMLYTPHQQTLFPCTCRCVEVHELHKTRLLVSFLSFYTPPWYRIWSFHPLYTCFSKT
jgi:hypothetical protein